MEYHLKMTGESYQQLRQHLFPGDEKEAIAFAICGRHSTGNQKWLLVHRLLFIPHDQCFRKGDFIEWPTHLIDDLVDEAVSKGMGILKIHSHPRGFTEFSELDDASDRIIFPSIYALMNDSEPHFSAIMYEDESIIARVVTGVNDFLSVNKITVVGDTVKLMRPKNEVKAHAASLRTQQTFGEGTVSLLKGLTVVVIGCSGTGSITIEQLARLGVGKLILADPDLIEHKNLNRILNSKEVDAIEKRAKVDVLKTAITSFGFNTEVEIYQTLVQDDTKLIDAIITADFVFGCVDSIEGRSIANSLATFYLLPYIDMGVKLVSDKKGGIDEISGSVHYLQPGKSSLLSRGVYTIEQLSSEELKRTNPTMYEEQRKRGYVVNMDVESPAVISINMQVSSLAVLEFLARIHPFRYDPNKRFAQTDISISEWEIWHSEESGADKYLAKFVGRGLMQPFLNSPSINRLWPEK
jgi:hypothetical protein